MKKYSPNKKCIVMTREQVRSFDNWAINQLGIAGVVLMENAGRSCAELIREKLSDIAKPKVCIFCGTGNNGGDGYVIARHLLNSGFKVVVVIIGDSEKIKGDALINLKLLEGMRQPIEKLELNISDIACKIKAYTEDAHILVDALFGTGLKGQLKAEYIELIECINAQNRTILAVDIPSGLDCDTGKPLRAAIKAAYTVTFVAVKTGFTLADTAAECTGEVFVASIGVEPTKTNLI